MRFTRDHEQIIDKWVRANPKRWEQAREKAHWLWDDRYSKPSFIWTDLPEDLRTELTRPPGPKFLETPMRSLFKVDRAFTEKAQAYLNEQAMVARVASRWLART